MKTGSEAKQSLPQDMALAWITVDLPVATGPEGALTANGGGGARVFSLPHFPLFK